MGPSTDEHAAEEAYKALMGHLKMMWRIQDGPPPPLAFKESFSKERQKRNTAFKEAVRALFELDAWESW
jgi:hypothetical protein